MLCEPDGIAALAGADVESTAGSETDDLVDQRAVRVAAPHLVASVAVIPVGFVAGWPGGRFDVFVGEAEADHGPGAAAIGGGGQHLLARIRHVSGRVQTGNRRRSGRIRLDEIAEPGRVRGSQQTERCEGLDTHPEARSDGDGVGVDAIAAHQLDRLNMAVDTRDDASDRLVDNR